MPPVAEVTFKEAIRQGLDEELARDEDVIFFGEDVALAGGCFQVTPGLTSHGEERVFDTPISELALSSAAFGAAAVGMRPVFEIMFADFIALAMDSLVSQSAKYWYFSGGEKSIPLTLRTTVGGGGQFGALHSQVPIPWLQAVPGLKLVTPALPGDAKALIKAAIRDDNPVVFLEHKRLYPSKGEVGDEEEVAEIGRAAVLREGSDVTLASASLGVVECLAAAEQLAEQGVDAEVVDLRTLRPLDRETLLASLAKTGRLVVVEEGPRTGGWAGEVIAIAAEDGLGDIDDVWRITLPDIPLPYSPPLEADMLPGRERIVREVGSRAGIGVTA